MKISELQDNQYVKVRTGFPGVEDVNWESWEDGILYVQNDRQGKPFLIGLRHKNWCEYSVPYDFDNGIFLCENYYMQIEGLDE